MTGQVENSGLVKVCSKCGATKALHMLNKDKGGIRGKKPYCRSCQNEAAKSYRSKNKELCNQRASEWRKANKEKTAKDLKEWKLKNKDRVNCNNAKRRAMRVDQTPELTQEEQKRIENLYWMARDLKAVSGQDYHVDHITPLVRGGLHHPDNLQILPADLNLQKGAKL